MLRFSKPFLSTLISPLLIGLACNVSSTCVFAADVDQLLVAMTLDEKLALLHGHKDPDPAIGLNSAGYLPGVPRLGIPPLRLADGPAGIRTDVTATALPAPVALAASFDPALAKRYGAVLGQEGIARNQQILLSPMVNLVRVPQAGRNFETFGEDPLLAGRIVAAVIDGIQRQHMLATVKHFAVNNQESERLNIDVKVDERSLHELYLPAFEAAVKAGVASVMCAYNRVNGGFACENDSLLNNILRQQWGFTGFVMTDWWANHSLAALANGLNMEMPGFLHPDYKVQIEFEEPLRLALTQQQLSMHDVDAAVRPLLDMMNRFGYLDGSLPTPAARNQDHHAEALEIALHSAVLLKNANALLPLNPQQIANTVLIGPTANWTLVGGGGSSRVLPAQRDSVRSTLALLSNTTTVQYEPGFADDGFAIPTSVWRHNNQPGLEMIAANGERSLVSSVEKLGANAFQGAGMWYWYADLIAPESGDYQLHVQTDGPTAGVYVDDKRVLFNDAGVVSDAELVPTQQGLRNSTVTLNLVAGQHYRIKVEAWTGDPKPVQLRLSWLPPSAQQQVIDDAIVAAAAAERVVVFAHQEGTETRDRVGLALPGMQDKVISALAAQYPGKVIVVLNVGAPITMPWLAKVSAVLQMWYPGQAGGEATARLLLGLTNPSGKLPVSFPRSESDLPINEPQRFPGVNGVQHYSEGLFIGYRWYDQQQITPLFPFGHGLSYTQFDYSDLVVNTDGSEPTASFTLRNGGQRAGAEVAQLYLSHSGSTPLPMEVRKLVNFDKVELAAGESKRITLTLPARSFSYWDSNTHAWQALAGNKSISVGASSRDLRLTANFEHKAPR
jgi:beta-glucosidase